MSTTRRFLKGTPRAPKAPRSTGRLRSGGKASKAAATATPAPDAEPAKPVVTDEMRAMSAMQDEEEEVFEDAFDDMSAIGELMEDEQFVGQHLELRRMCVINCDTAERLVPNKEPMILDNECFVGKTMLLIRTPDVDNTRDGTPLDATPTRISNYFRGKKRRFEFQFQIKLKRVPTGPLFLGCEVETPIKVGGITKGLVNFLLAMVRRINPGFHYSWGPDANLTQEQIQDGDYEKTHLSFPLEASMDRVIISKPGETPPELGYELYESNESVKRRRKTGSGCIDWNLEDTYTMCLWSAYVDWIKWKSLNVPGVAPFVMSRITGQQPIYLCVYEISDISATDYRKKRPGHTRKNLRVYSRFEFSNPEHTLGGFGGKLLKGKVEGVVSSENSIPDTASSRSTR